MDSGMQYGSVESTELSPSSPQECCDNRLRRRRFTLTQLIAAVLTSAVASALITYAPWGSARTHPRQVSYPVAALFPENPDARLGSALPPRVPGLETRTALLPSPPAIANATAKKCVIDTCRKKKCNDSVEGYCFYECVHKVCGYNPFCISDCYPPCSASGYHKTCVTYCILLDMMCGT